MIWFKKASSWLVNHWQYAAVSVLAIVAYVLGSNKHKALKIQADLARRQYKKEAYMIDKEYQSANEKKKKAEEKYQKSVAALDKQYAKDSSKLDKSKDKYYKKQLREARKDPEKIDSILKNLGIEEV